MALTNETNPMLAKAWCKWDGTGTPSITESFNCSSITDIATGDFSINWSITFTESEITATGSASNAGDMNRTMIPTYDATYTTTTSSHVDVRYTNTSNQDCDYNTIFAFGGVA